jgi:hypothetical protein
MAEQLHLMSEKLERRSLILIFSDLFDLHEDEEGLFDALQHLKHGKHEIVLFWTTDRKTEQELKLESRPYKFVDIETGASVKLNPADWQESYQKKSHEFAQKLRTRCLQYKIDLVEADVAQGYYPVLQSYLIKRRRLK